MTISLTVNGRQVSVDDGFKDLSREDQQAMVEHIAESMPDDSAAPAPRASGTAAGLVHSLNEMVHGDAETAKQFAGVGNGVNPRADNYVPANVTNGSFNPLDWNYSQIPQKVAEAAPGVAQDLIASGAAKAVLGKVPVVGKYAPLAAAALSAWMRTAGDKAKEAAANRTGDQNAEPDLQDKLRGGGVAAASAAVGSIAPTRLLPGAGKSWELGTQGALDAAKRYLATTGIGAAGGAASDAVDQLGMNGTYDPKRGLEAAVGGAATNGVMGIPAAANDAAGLHTFNQFGGDNLNATKAYAQRMKDTGLDLSKTQNGAQAHDTAKADIANELKDAAKAVRSQTTLSPEADNALQRAQAGEPLTDKDVATIQAATAGTPDGANATHLARQALVAQMAEGIGSRTDKGWAGGASGTLEKNMGFMLNPTRVMGGAIASQLFGMHLLGTSNPMFAGGVMGGYMGVKALDSISGMRSPAEAFAERFASAPGAQVRMAPNAPPQAPQPPPQAPQGPWGPKPLPQQSVPQAGVQPQAPITPGTQPWSAPKVNPLWQGPNPVSLSMLKAKLKAGLPPEPQAPPPAPKQTGYSPAPMPAMSPAPLPAAPTQQQMAQTIGGKLNPLALSMLKQQLKQPPAAAEPQPAQAPAAPPITPGTAPWKAPTVTELPQFSPQALKMLAAKLKANEAAQPPAPPPAPPAQPKPPAPIDPNALPSSVTRGAKNIMGGINKVSDMKAEALKPTGEPSTLNAAAAPKVAAASLKASIKKSSGSAKVKVEQPTPEQAPSAPFEPLGEEDLYHRDITPGEYGIAEAAAHNGGSVYRAKAEATARGRITSETELVEKHPADRAVIKSLVRQLHKAGRERDQVNAVVNHYADLAQSPEAASDIRRAFLK